VFPNKFILTALRTQFNVSFDWLFIGIGKMFILEKDEKDRGEAKYFGEYGEEVRELLYFMNNAPMVKHAILGFFIEYKIKYKEILQRLLDESHREQQIKKIK
jgi:hypothetical protein